MKTSKIDLFSENILTINEMLNVRGGDGDEEVPVTIPEGEDEDIII